MDQVVSFLTAAVVAGTPLLFATLGGILNERAGHLNLGVEGMMLMGAVIGFQFSISTQNPFIAVAAGAMAGLAGALIYAVLTVTFRANQVVTGLTLSIFGTGFSSFVGQKLMGMTTPESFKVFFAPQPIPVLSNIPIVGPILFKQDVFVYFGYLMVIILGIYVYKTRWGLNLTAVGHNPSAADAASINVTLYKYVHILASGALCGLGGAYLSLVYVPSWQENITAGMGWIAVALVIFATWNPYKAVLGAYLFGGLSIIGFRLQGTGIAISQYLIDMLPYIVTIVVLVMISSGNSAKNSPPKALGVAYYREER